MSDWKFTESPLVDGDRVVVTPGAPDAALVALDKKTGKTIWKAAVPALGPNGRDGAGYSSIVISNSTAVPSAKCGAAMVASAISFFRTGDHVVVVARPIWRPPL